MFVLRENRRSGVLTSFLYDVISGKSRNPSTIKLARVADALGVNLIYLACGSETNYPTNPQTSTSTSIKESYISLPYISASNHKNQPYLFHKEWLENTLHANVADLRIFVVNDDTMQPILYPNDVIIVDTSKKQPSSSGIFILLDDGCLKAKQLEYCNNHNYQLIEHSSTNSVIIGRAVWLSRAL